MLRSAGRHIKLYLIDGAPDGMRTAEIGNWTGHVLYAPRSRIVDILRRPEVQRTGVYLLIGKDPSDANAAAVYVGQGDDVGVRLARHNAEKEFWDYVCVVTNKDLNLTSAHVRYLESRLVSIVKSEGRASILNGNEPKFDRLPEADTYDMEDFIVRLQVLLPVLGVEFVKPTPNLSSSSEVRVLDSATKSRELNIGGVSQSKPAAGSVADPVFRFSSASVKAKAVEVGGQMIVLKGSQAQPVDQPSLPSYIRTLRDQFQRSGKLLPNPVDGLLDFTEDVAFSSPSAAAQAIMGTSRNGRIDWIVEGTGQTYAGWQEQQVTNAEGGAVVAFVPRS